MTFAVGRATNNDFPSCYRRVRPRTTRSLPIGGTTRRWYVHSPTRVPKQECDAMQIPRDATLLRIFVGQDEKHGHRPLYEAIVLKAREMHLAGATVLRGPMGFGHSSRLHTTKILRLSGDLPVVIEIVDRVDLINEFLPTLDAIMTSGLVTLERVQVLRYGAKADAVVGTT
jgi:uncharacterized protein